MPDSTEVVAFSLDELDVVAAAESGTITELLNPFTNKPLLDEQGNPYFVEHRGFDAAVVDDLDTRFANKRIEDQRKGKPREIAVYEAETVAKLCASTIRWYLPPLKKGGEPIREYTHALGKQIYGSKPLKWIAEQMIDDAKDRTRFFKKGFRELMIAIAHEAQLNTFREEKGKERTEWRTERQHLESVAHVNAGARARLVAPEYPSWIEFLRTYSSDLYARSGSMNGELTWPAYDAWARRMHRDLPPYQIDALFQLDAVRRNPDQVKAEAPIVPIEKKIRGSAWPSKDRHKVAP